MIRQWKVSSLQFFWDESTLGSFQLNRILAYFADYQCMCPCAQSKGRCKTFVFHVKSILPLPTGTLSVWSDMFYCERNCSLWLSRDRFKFKQLARQVDRHPVFVLKHIWTIRLWRSVYTFCQFHVTQHLNEMLYKEKRRSTLQNKKCFWKTRHFWRKSYKNDLNFFLAVAANFHAIVTNLSRLLFILVQ